MFLLLTPLQITMPSFHPDMKRCIRRVLLSNVGTDVKRCIKQMLILYEDEMNHGLFIIPSVCFLFVVSFLIERC